MDPSQLSVDPSPQVLSVAGQGFTTGLTVLVTRPNGTPWQRTNHAYPFRLVAKACGQDPAEVTIYALRHSSIVRQLLAGVPVRIVAAGHDTSVAMIERNYSRYITDHADALVRSAMLNLAPRDQPKRAVIGNPLFVAG